MNKKEYMEELTRLMRESTKRLEDTEAGDVFNSRYHMGFWEGLLTARRLAANHLDDYEVDKDKNVHKTFEFNDELLLKDIVKSFDFAKKCTVTVFEDDLARSFWEDRTKLWKNMAKKRNIYIIEEEDE